jgi:hypothetical protein
MGWRPSFAFRIFDGTHLKKACRCDHGKAIHYAGFIRVNKFQHYYRHPGCKCRDYKPTKKS